MTTFPDARQFAPMSSINPLITLSRFPRPALSRTLGQHGLDHLPISPDRRPSLLRTARRRRLQNPKRLVLFNLFDKTLRDEL